MRWYYVRVSQAPSVAIVTVNYNSAGFIGDFIDSLARVDYPNVQLVVVDAASADGSADEIARRCPQAHLIRCDENVGIARGNNLGVAYCRERGITYALFLNNDTTHEPDFLRVLVDAAQADDAVGAQESDGDPLLFDTVDLEQGTAALQDPHIGKVLDVFKGQIVDLQQPTQPKDSA